ncbi:amphi-Trp domain-containing protein [Haloferax marisrubri]|nr:amphi-Trp domain-containing protein [Haloferax marisrubri]
MSMDWLFETEIRDGRGGVAAFLRNVADRLENGTVEFSDGDEDVSLPVPENLELAVRVARGGDADSDASDADRPTGPDDSQRVQLELSWDANAT